MARGESLPLLLLHGCGGRLGGGGVVSQFCMICVHMCSVLDRTKGVASGAVPLRSRRVRREKVACRGGRARGASSNVTP